MICDIAAAYRGPLLSVWDLRCRGHDSTSEEESDAFEIVLVRRGAFTRECRGKTVVVDSSTALFTKPGDVFRVRHPAPGGDRCTVFRFRRSGASSLLHALSRPRRHRHDSRSPVRHVHVPNELFLAHCALVRDLRHGVGDLEIEERALEITRSLVSSVVAVPPTDGSVSAGVAREYACRVREILAKRFLEPVTVADVAREACCSPFHLSRLMQIADGVSIHGLVVQLRLREALRQLLDDTAPISRVAIRTGFSSHSHFSAAFRRAFGITPRAARSGRLTRTLRRRLSASANAAR